MQILSQQHATPGVLNKPFSSPAVLVSLTTVIETSSGSRHPSVTSEVHFRDAEVTRLPSPSASLFPVEESGDDVQVGGLAAENRATSTGQGHLRGRGRGLCAVSEAGAW